jgi:hypothetical protein
MNPSLLQKSPLKEQLEWTGEELQRGITRAGEEYCNTYVLLYVGRVGRDGAQGHWALENEMQVKIMRSPGK